MAQNIINSIFPSQYLPTTFVYAENPTSIKLNLWSGYIQSQFNLLGIGLGSIFSLGEGSVAGSIGDIRTITPTSFSSSDGAINIVTPIYSNGNFYFNEIVCTAATSGSNTVLTLNANNAINGSLSGNFAGTFGTVTILNAIVVSKTSGQITTVYPGTLQTPIGWTLGTDITGGNTVTLVNQILNPGTYYIEVPNFSLSYSILNGLTNIGGMLFSRGLSTTAYIDNSNDDTFDQFSNNKTATVTNMINRIDNKIFTIRLHIRVPIASYDSQDGTNRYWTITPSSAPHINSANPATATIQNYIKYNLLSYPPQTNAANYDIFAAANGAVILNNIGSVVTPFISYSAGTSLTVGLSQAAIGNLGTSGSYPYGVASQIPSYIDFYIPVSLPYYALQSRAINYNTEKLQIQNLLANVLGFQYGWGQTNYPDTIANRLAAIEAYDASLNTFQNQVQVYTSNGTFTTTSSTKKVTIDLVSGGGGGGGWNSNNNGGGGGGGGYMRIIISVSPNTAYTVQVGGGGGGQDNGVAGGNGGNTTFDGYTVTGGGGGPTGIGGGTGGAGYAILPTVTAGALVLQSFAGQGGGNGTPNTNTGGNGGTGGGLNTSLINGLFPFTIGTISSGNTSGAGQDGNSGNLYGGGGVGALKNHGGGNGANGIVIIYY